LCEESGFFLIYRDILSDCDGFSALTVFRFCVICRKIAGKRF